MARARFEPRDEPPAVPTPSGGSSLINLLLMNIHDRCVERSLKSRIVEQASRAQGLDNAQMLRERADQLLLERYAKVLLHRTVGRLLVGPIYSKIGATEFLDAGGSQLVFLSRPNQLVQKLLIPSIGISKSEATEHTDHLSEVTDEAAAYLEHYQAPTRYKPVKMPKMIGGYAVIATQPFIKATHRFAEIQELWGMPQTGDLTMQQGDLIHRIRDLRANSMMYPDLRGDGNIVLIDDNSKKDQIRIVDTIPVIPDMLDWPAGDGSSDTNDEYYGKLMNNWLEALETNAA